MNHVHAFEWHKLELQRCGYQIKAKFVALIKRVTFARQNFKEFSN